jgi:hypothetical protein
LHDTSFKWSVVTKEKSLAEQLNIKKERISPLVSGSIRSFKTKSQSTQGTVGTTKTAWAKLISAKHQEKGGSLSGRDFRGEISQKMFSLFKPRRVPNPVAIVRPKKL